jgi:tricorn protease
MRRIAAATLPLVLALPFALAALPPAAEAPRGYYRFPAIHGEVVVFTAEGDLWSVGAAGGEARRLTSHLGQETHAAISPDGRQVAFTAEYEGAPEVYVMPIDGGLPKRLTYHGERATVVGWTPGGEVLYATRHFSTLPETRLAVVDPASGQSRLIPLSEASEGVFDPSGATLFFTRFPFQGSYTKRYRGGTAQSVWRFTQGEPEAVPLTADYPGTSHWPMWWQGRVYFASDRDGTMNLWSMDPAGGDLRQLTRHAGWDVKSPRLSDGRIVYQLGADLRLFDVAAGSDGELPITLPSDLDQRRQRWVADPMDYLTAAHLSPDGDRVALTARGQVFVAPVGQGRLVEASRQPGVRYRSARFFPDGKSLSVLSDATGEVELWRLDARGTAAPAELTHGGKVLRFDGLPSPDGRFIAYTDKDQELWVVEVASGRQTRVDTSQYFGFGELAWSPDGRWLAYSVPAANFFSQLKLYEVAAGTRLTVTSDRFDSDSPAFSPDGRWLYFLSDRHLVSVTRSPWGNHQPGPFLDRKSKIYLVALRRGLVSPWAPANELLPPEEAEKTEETEEGGGAAAKEPAKAKAAKGKAGKGKSGEGKDSEKEQEEAPVEVVIDAEGLAERLYAVPVAAGNYSSLAVAEENLFYLAADTAPEPKRALMALPIEREKPQPVRLADAVESYELSADGEHLLIRQEDDLYVRPATAEPIEDPSEDRVDLDAWTFTVDPAEEWRQMYVEAWRLFRDYFYDPGMHGVDWPAMRDKYLPLVSRITDRAELSDLLGELSGELSALHHFVRGGDFREGEDDVEPASLGAVLERDEAAGGFRVKEVYATDPDLPEELAPLARPGVDVAAGAVILAVNGVPALAAADLGELLRNQAGRQVLLAVADRPGGEKREVIVEPIGPERAFDLRYSAWEYRRRQLVEKWGGGEIGYVHLRSMSGGSYTEWARDYFPVFDRKGLVIDVRHNRGGNIDSWILGSLIRKAWMWWAPRKGEPYSNMQDAFTGRLAVVVDPFTISDGEAFAEGFRRLGLGEVVGARTWGGEIWLTSSNVLVDKGIATAAEYGVYGPEGEWLIEGHGVDPDVVVDNLPHATFDGDDAQLKAAVDELLERIRENPPVTPLPPPYPDKAGPPAPPYPDGSG